jgi:hypothetical protein
MALGFSFEVRIAYKDGTSRFGSGLVFTHLIDMPLDQGSGSGPGSCS